MGRGKNIMDVTDDEIKKLEEDLKKIESMDTSGYGSPSEVKKDTIFKFFKEILDSLDSRKTGNLEKNEIGQVTMGVRSYFDIALYAETEGLDKVADYFGQKAEIILSTSMSRKAKFMELIVTQIRKQLSTKEPKPVKSGWFKKKTGEE